MKRFTCIVVGAMSFELSTLAHNEAEARRNVDEMLYNEAYGIVSIKEDLLYFQ
jgi:hypothetical protein